jgi:hypothetical protein
LLKSLRKRGGLAYNAQLDNKSQILEYSKGERLNSRRNILFMELQNVLFFWNDQMKYFRKTNRN